MHDDASQLAAFGLASFALVAALIPLVGDAGPGRALESTRRVRRKGVPFLYLLVEIGIAGILFAAGVRVHLVSDAADLGLTVAWLVAVAVSFRILANLEGAAAVVACGAAVGVAVAAALQDQRLVADVATVLAGTSAAALVCSWPPARVRLKATFAIALGLVFGALTLELHYPAAKSDGRAAVALVAAAPLFLAALVVLDSWGRRRPLRLSTEHRRGAASPAVVVAMTVTATAVLVVAGVAVMRGAAPAWAGGPAGAVAGVLVLTCLATVERRPPEPESVVAEGEQRRQLELLPATRVSPAAISALHPNWAVAEDKTASDRAQERTENFNFRVHGEEHNGDGPADSPDAAVEEELPTTSDTLSFHWPPTAGVRPARPEPRRPSPHPALAMQFDHPFRAAHDEAESDQNEDLHAEVRDLMQMTKSMLEQLGALAEQLAPAEPGDDNATTDGAETGAGNGHTHGGRRVEARLQALVDDMRERLRARVRPSNPPDRSQGR